MANIIDKGWRFRMLRREDLEEQLRLRENRDWREKSRAFHRASFHRGVGVGFLGGLGLMLLLMVFLVMSGTFRISGIPLGGYGYPELEDTILTKVHLLERYISAYFLDDLDEDKMADSIYKGLVNGLGDTYAAYYTKDEFQSIQEKNKGSYCGIGAYIATDQKTGLVQVVQPVTEDSPIAKAGGKAGDLIYKVDGKDMTGKEIAEVQALVKGEKGSSVKLTVIRGKEQMELTVIRDEIREDTVTYQMLPNKIGYVQVSGFEEVTTEQFSNAIDELEKQNQTAMIIDLRNNGGGLLDAAVKMLDKLLPKGMVVYSEDKNGKRNEYFAEAEDQFTKPLAILVNGHSASASEVFSGVLQEKKVGILVGTQTFGKGIVQGIFDLGDGSALKITTAKYYTPGGKNIHGKGFEPDVKVELKEGRVKLSDGKTEVDNQVKAAWEHLQ